jgi:hypothetical protein
MDYSVDVGKNSDGTIVSQWVNTVHDCAIKLQCSSTKIMRLTRRRLASRLKSDIHMLRNCINGSPFSQKEQVECTLVSCQQQLQKSTLHTWKQNVHFVTALEVSFVGLPICRSSAVTDILQSSGLLHKGAWRPKVK